jgi:hypothetical protein
MSEDSPVNRLRRLPDIPAGQNTWRTYMNGVEIPQDDIQHLLLVLERPGRPALGLELGWIDDGKFQYDGLSHFETAGGAIVVVPFLIWEEELYIALITQTRFHVGGEVETVPRGYAELNKSAAEQAESEGSEEMGGDIAKWTAFELDGVPASPNTSLSNTSRPRPDGTPAGSRFFAREIDVGCIEEDENGRPRFKEGSVNPTDPKENITSWRLAPWWEAAQLHDSCPAIATIRLMAHLNGLGRCELAYLGELPL